MRSIGCGAPIMRTTMGAGTAKAAVRSTIIRAGDPTTTGVI